MPADQTIGCLYVVCAVSRVLMMTACVSVRRCYSRLPRSPWRRHRRVMGVGVVFVVMVTVVSMLRSAWRSQQCDNNDSTRMLEELCDKYNEHYVAGNLCPHLCTYRTVWFHACANYRTGKQALRARWMGQNIVLKSKYPRLEDYDQINFVLSFRDFNEMVVDSLRTNFPHRLRHGRTSGLEELWLGDVSDHMVGVPGESWSEDAVASLWSLVQQDEYLLSVAFRHFDYFPTVLGSCGHFYAVEEAPPGPLLSPGFLEFIGLRNQAWQPRANLALALIETLQAFDKGLDGEALHMCDMKGDNFGVAQNRRVKPIDTDMALVDSRLLSNLVYPNCTKHEDCSFFDCHGWCDHSIGHCVARRVNNNWQSLCAKILRASSSNGWFGLLRSPPAAFSGISDILVECASPTPSELLPGCSRDNPTGTITCHHDSSEVAFKANYSLIKRLTVLLKESIR